jgi:CRISPR/Cas system-associated endonuclease Cas1
MPSLILNLMEELRSPLADRLVLTLINSCDRHKGARSSLRVRGLKYYHKPE